MADVPLRHELHTVIEHLKDEARKDRECGWPKKAEKKEQAAELLRRAYADEKPWPFTGCSGPLCVTDEDEQDALTSGVTVVRHQPFPPSDASGYTTDAAGVVQPPLAWLIEDGAGYRGLTFVDPQTAEGAWDGFTITPLFAASPEALLRQALDVLERLIALQWPLEDASTSDGCYTDDPAEQQARAALAALRQALGGKA